MDELRKVIQTLATEYLTESDDGDDESGVFPISIVDFILENAYERCNFPNSFAESKRISILEKNKRSIAMACVDIYLKIGAEGQSSYSINGITRRYKADWINWNLLNSLPNYVSSL